VAGGYRLPLRVGLIRLALCHVGDASDHSAERALARSGKDRAIALHLHHACVAVTIGDERLQFTVWIVQYASMEAIGATRPLGGSAKG
jgi:hypothetical protein